MQLWNRRSDHHTSKIDYELDLTAWIHVLYIINQHWTTFDVLLLVHKAADQSCLVREKANQRCYLQHEFHKPLAWRGYIRLLSFRNELIWWYLLRIWSILCQFFWNKPSAYCTTTRHYELKSRAWLRVNNILKHVPCAGSYLYLSEWFAVTSLLCFRKSGLLNTLPTWI